MAIGGALKGLVFFGALFGGALPAVQALASEKVAEYVLLAERRPELRLPVYTTDERRVLLEQVNLLLRDLYVHREQKISFYGTAADPFPELERISSEASVLPEAELHQRLEAVFQSQRDLHTNYYYPKPYACYRALLPFSFDRVRDSAGRDVIAVAAVVEYAELLKLVPEAGKIRKGDVLVELDGQEPAAAVAALYLASSGANEDGRYRRAVETLTYRSQSMGILPERNSARLRLRNRQGQEYAVEIPWISRARLSCLGQKEEGAAPAVAKVLDRGDDELQLEIQRFYRPHRRHLRDGEGEWKKTAEPGIQYGVIDNEHGTFGYLRLDDFSPSEVSEEAAVYLIRGLLEKELAATDGLIIDIRGNGGGTISYGEGLVQLFVPADVDAQPFRLVANPLNRKLVEAWNEGPEWLRRIDRAILTGARHTEPLPLSSPARLNALGQSYFKPVAVLTDASCYSTCDMFSASMQDHAGARIFAQDRWTGAGGANVVNHSSFVGTFPEGQAAPLAKLPGGQDMRTAWRQTVRVGKHAGQLLEDYGVAADEVVPRALVDLFSADAAQFRVLSAWLARESKGRVSSAALARDGRQDYLVGTPLRLEASVMGTEAVELRQAGVSLGLQAMAAQTAPTALVLDAPISPAVGSIGSVDLLGYLRGARVWKKVVHYRIVPVPLKLAEGQAIRPELAAGAEPLTVFNDGNDAADGWTAAGGELRIGKGEKYANDVRTEASLFLDLSDRAAARLSFTARVNTEADYDFFSVSAWADGVEEPLLKPVSGDLAEQAYAYDLSKYAGRKVELRFLFTSDSGVVAPGVSVRSLTVE
jgi:C-terminal processing protease CtpA/Prc